jgi:putative two-component system response regulator
LSHHEKWNGEGYPDKLKGDAIPISGRLMAVADVYDALRSRRVYKPAKSHDQASTIILAGKGSHFDPDMVDAFVAVADQFIAISARYAD